MSTNVRVIHSADFLRARADGRIDLEQGRILLGQIAQAAAGLERFEVLVDIRNAVGQLSADDLHELAGSLVVFRDTFLNKTAVLCPRERFDNARFFTLLAASYGFNRIRAFLSYEDAMEWLLAPDPA
jgi:hypothetical protein